jgi:hypothetical protein
MKEGSLLPGGFSEAGIGKEIERWRDSMAEKRLDLLVALIVIAFVVGLVTSYVTQ